MSEADHLLKEYQEAGNKLAASLLPQWELTEEQTVPVGQIVGTIVDGQHTRPEEATNYLISLLQTCRDRQVPEELIAELCRFGKAWAIRLYPGGSKFFEGIIPE